MPLLKTLLIVFAIFTALGIACAVYLALRDAGRIGSRPSSPRPDPYSSVFGDVPYTGFTSRQLGIVAPTPFTDDHLNRSFAKRVELACGAGMRSHHVDLNSAPALRRNASSPGDANQAGEGALPRIFAGRPIFGKRVMP